MPLSYFPDAKKLDFRYGENDTLELHMDGQVASRVLPKRALPLSEPNRFIVLYDADHKELGMLCDVNDLEPESKAVLQKVLEKVYYIRHIARIVEINKEPATGQTRWRVELEDEDDDKEDGDKTSEVEERSTPALTMDRKSIGENGKNYHGEYHNLPQNNQQDGHQNNGSGNQNSVVNIGGVLRNKFNQTKDSLNGNGKGKAFSGPPRKEVEFCIKGPEDVQTARYPYVFMVDVDGNRYDIPDCDALDLDSRRCSEGFL